MPANFPQSVRMEAIRALDQLDGFAENKAWLSKTGIHIEDVSASLIAQYEEPKNPGGVGRILVARTALERSWVSLNAQGLNDAAVARLTGWMLAPSLIHESQHAIQVDAMHRIGLSFYALETEIQAEAFGMTAYLQILARFPELGAYPFYIKSQNNASLLTWREGFAAFCESTRQYYPRVPSALNGGLESHLQMASELQVDTIADVDKLLESENDPKQRENLERMKTNAESYHLELRDPARREALMSFYREIAASAERLWTVWNHLDPSRRLKRDPTLTPEAIAETALKAARALSAVSPVYHNNEILEHLETAAQSASQSGNPVLRRQAQEQLREFKSSLPAYARAVIRSNAATAQDPVKFEADMKEYLESLRGKLTPSQSHEAGELIRKETQRLRRIPPAP